MRKCKLFFISLIAALLLLTGCGAQKEANVPHEDVETSQAEASPQTEGTQEISSVTVNVATSSLKPTAVPRATPEPTATPEPLPTPYTVAWISDTQAMANNYPEILVKMGEYVLSAKEEYNIVAFFHTGDIVDSCGSKRQWESTTTAFLPLVEEFTTFMAAGNHDEAQDRGEGRELDLFTCREMVQKAWEGMEAYRVQGEAGYRIMELGGEEILIAVVSYGSSVSGRRWLATEINAHSDIPAIIVTHSALFGDGRYTPDGNRLNTDVVSQCPSVRLVLCGHARGITNRRLEMYDDDGDGAGDRAVNVLMCNFQEDSKNGLGYLRLLTFDPVSRNISVVTYSPWYDLYTYGDLSEEDMAFTLANAF